MLYGFISKYPTQNILAIAASTVLFLKYDYSDEIRSIFNK